MSAIEKELGEEVAKFLRAISPSNPEAPDKLGPSAQTYYPGLGWFQRYLVEQSLSKESAFPRIKSIHLFLVAVKADAKIENSLKRCFPDRELLKTFATSLLKENKAPKTVRSYVGSVQSLAKYFDIPITTAYSDLPPAIAENEKYPWSIEQVGDFIKSFDSPMYRCLGVWFIQTGLSNYDLLHMPYSKIKEQYENSINPFCLNLVRHKTRKFEIKFRAFIGTLGIRYFRTYYESLDHALSDDDLIFNVSSVAVEKYFERRAKEFISKDKPKERKKKSNLTVNPVATVDDPITATLKKKRNPMCPSSLRTGFRTFLSDGKVTNSIIEYLMGHNLTSDLEKTYTNKSDDSWRKTWQEFEPLLTFQV
ncbi:MAG: hypothetical protein ABSC20_08185 [Candidatus Bathyarchaeia archaeon]|jgi:hypothetical protein